MTAEFGLALTAFAGGLLMVHLISVAVILPRLMSCALPRPVETPFLTLLRPVCGLDPFDAETLGTSFDQDWPEYEVLFCVADAADPVVPVVRRLIADHPERRAALMIGVDVVSGNPKLNNLVKGWAAAQADWIVMADANLLLPRDYLSTLVATRRPDTGLVSSPPLGIRAEGLWGALEAAFLNTYQARWQLAADTLGWGFAQGKTLFWPRALLDRAGGLSALGRDLAEDVAATKVVRAAGLRVRLTARPFAQPIGRRSFSAVWGRQVRWGRVRRQGFPALFVAEVLNGAVVPALALALAIWGGTLPALALPAFLILWYGAEVALARLAGWPMGPLDMLALPLRDLLLPVLWGAIWAGRGFAWRGNAMGGATSAPAEPAPSARGTAE